MQSTSEFQKYSLTRTINKCNLYFLQDSSEFRDKKAFIGTTRYASIAAHKGYELSRKDDIESLLYVAIFLVIGQLPWQGVNCSDKDRTRVVGEMKHKMDPKELCKELPEEFATMLEYTKKLQYKDEPDYKYLLTQLDNISKKAGF